LLRQRIYLPLDFRYDALSSSATSHISKGTSLILVPHDGTEISEKALNKTVEFAQALRAKIILLHIVDDRIVPASDTIGFVSEEQPSLEIAKMQLIKILKQGAELMLKDRISKVKQAGIEIQFMMGVGSPAEEIVIISESEHVDLIIMGSRRLNEIFKNVSLGSVARRVSEIAKCPVMLIH
jgi:nucleotide-binding universal stress UspA family protein